MKPILSIAIPTYNRGPLLEKVLNCMVSESAFVNGDDVEIVVSDNASEDNTQEVCERYAAQFPNKFIYHRQCENKGYSENVATLMRIANGEFIKFNCDTFYFVTGKMSEALELIRKWREEKPVIFFRNDHLLHYPEGVYVEDSFDRVLEVNSFLPMWTGGFGIWSVDKEEALKIHYQTADSWIPQVAVFWHLFDLRRKAVIHNHPIMREIWSPKTHKKAIGNRAEIFGKFYMDIMKTYVTDEKISKRSFEKEKKRLFFCAVYRPYFDFFHEFIPTRSGYIKYTHEYFCNWYYWFFLAIVPIFYLIGAIPRSWTMPMRKLYKRIKEKLLQ